MTPARRVMPWLATVAALVFVALSPLAAAMSRETSGPALNVWITVQVVATAAAWLIPQLVARRSQRHLRTAEQRELEARVESRVAMNDALDPIVRLLGRIAIESNKRERQRRRAQAVPFVLNSASQLIGPERARACWFELQAGPPRRLVPVEAAGRAGPARSTFEDGTDGAAVIEMVMRDESILCENVNTQPPPGWDTDQAREYQTFIAVPVIAQDVVYGMLTLDSLEPGDLTKEDMRLLRLMAGLLAAALGAP